MKLLGGERYYPIDSHSFSELWTFIMFLAPSAYLLPFFLPRDHQPTAEEWATQAIAAIESGDPARIAEYRTPPCSVLKKPISEETLEALKSEGLCR